MKETMKNLRLVAFESIVTAGILSIPIMTPFFNSIGLNQEQISLSQMIFTIVIMTLNIPAGWIADRFSRKWANVIGDFGCCLSLVFYAQVQDFAGVVICETSLGLFMAFSQGVDASLLRHFSGKIDGSGKLFKTTNGKVASLQYLCTLVMVLLGGPIGAIDFRLAIGLSSISFLAGGVASLFIKDDSENLIPQQKNPLRDMTRVVKSAMKNPHLRLRIFAFAVSRECTHGIIWAFTPLLLLAGVPLAWVSVGWAVNSIAGFFGSRIAAKYAHTLREWQVFAIPIVLVATGTSVMLAHFGMATVWLYSLMGLAQGWTSAAMMPLVQQHAHASEQTSIVSAAKVIAQLLYIPSVWLIGVATDIKTEYSMLATLLIFLPLSLPILIKLRKE
ncbi:MAG: MFS transporter [Candidatus Nomurabacteria bacterium]|jgi:MFS family permease|nr:MFS transporter [Candidatus Nomurabacteria bacterium]